MDQTKSDTRETRIRLGHVVNSRFGSAWKSTVNNLEMTAGQVTRSVESLVKTLETGQGEALKVMENLSKRIAKNRNVLEKRLSNGLKTVITRVKVVASDELKGLESRMDDLGGKLGRIVKKGQ